MPKISNFDVNGAAPIAVLSRIALAAVGVGTGLVAAFGFGRGIDSPCNNGLYGLGLNLRSSFDREIGIGGRINGLRDGRYLHGVSSVVGQRKPLEEVRQLLLIRYEQIINHFMVNYSLDKCNMFLIDSEKDMLALIVRDEAAL